MVVASAQIVFFLQGDGVTTSFVVDLTRIPLASTPGSTQTPVHFSPALLQVDIPLAAELQNLLIMQAGGDRLALTSYSFSRGLLAVEMESPLPDAEIVVSGFLLFPLVFTGKKTWRDRVRAYLQTLFHKLLK
jgi:hypothetical protein